MELDGVYKFIRRKWQICVSLYVHAGSTAGVRFSTCVCVCVQVMEVQVAELAERMQLHSNALEPGKAVCILAAQYRRCSMNIRLMDVLDLQLSL